MSELATCPCPVCGRAMAPLAHGDLELDWCADCRGVWFDAEELATFLRSRRAAQAVELEPLPSAGALACPRCSTESVLAYQAGDAYVSQCGQCGGVYVDNADLRALVGQRRRPKPATDDAGLDGWWLGDALATTGPVVHAAARRAIHIVWQAGAGLLEGL